MNLETVKLMQANPTSWREILLGSPYYLDIKEDEDFALLKYNQVKSDFHLSVCRECRGLIINKHTLQPVALSFLKFFNASESLADNLDWKSTIVREKIDGSKILCWYDGRNWRVSTSGTLDAYQAPINNADLTFGSVWEEALKNNDLTPQQLFDKLDVACCYTFELVSPDTRVVITYPKADLYLIGVRDVATFTEYRIEDFNLGIKTPEKFELSTLDNCLKVARELGSDKEGFVAQDRYFKRVKIKSPTYVALHHVRLNGAVTEARILEVLETGECSEFFGYFPEYLPLRGSVETKKNNFFTVMAPVCVAIKTEYLQTSKKEVAIHIMRDFKDISGVLFSFLKSDLDVSSFLQDYWERSTIDRKCKLLKLS